MLYNAKNLRLELGGTYMDYISFGTGEKPLLLIPGLNLRGVRGAALSLAFMYRIFAREYKVYVFDRKAEIDDNCSIKSHSEDLAAAMNALGISDAYVFGVSQGGMIGLQLAADHPELVKKLVPALSTANSNATVTDSVNAWIEMAEQGKCLDMMKDFFGKMYTEVYLKKYSPLIPLLSKTVSSSALTRFSKLAKSCLNFDIRGELHKISCPVFVIGAGEDKIVTGEASLELAEKLGAELYIYPNLGHAAYEEAKDFNQKIYDFFKK